MSKTEALITERDKCLDGKRKHPELRGYGMWERILGTSDISRLREKKVLTYGKGEERLCKYLH